MYRTTDYNIFNEWADTQHFQRIDKYSNYISDEKRIETWEEVVTRSVDTLRYLSDNKLENEKYQRIFELIYSGEIAPSMRLLSMPLEAIKRCNTVLYNCSFGLCDRINIFAEALYLGMSGCGVAFSVEKKNVSKLPVIKYQTGGIDNILIEDSQEGWARSVNQLMNALYAGYDIEFDYSLIRPSGSPLKIKGGFASGSKPLQDIHGAMRRIVKSAQGRKLKSIEVYDLMNWMLEAGISGATRRSAGLVLFDNDDEEMLNAKYSGFWNNSEHKIRANSNNTVVIDGNVSMDELKRLTAPWFNGLGEPGIFNRDNAINNAPEWRSFPDPEYIGINSCFVAGTMVQTKNGHYPIESLIGKSTEVWNGYEWTKINTFRVTGENEKVYTVTLHDGTEITATEYHNFILEDGTRKLLSELEVGDRLKISEVDTTNGTKKINGAYFKGFLVGDGTTHKERSYPILYLYEPKYMCKQRLTTSLLELEAISYGTYEKFDVDWVSSPSASNRQVMTGVSCRRAELSPYLDRSNGLPYWIFQADYESKCNFIAGLFDADGMASDTGKHGFMYQYSSIHYNLLKDIQTLLKTIGVQSTLRLNKESSTVDFNDGYGEYHSKTLYRLTINQQSAVALAKQVVFERLTSFANKYDSYTRGPYNVRPRWNRIVSIEDVGIADEVYCCTVPETHQFSLSCGIDVGNCGEISLAPSPIDGSVIGGGWHFCNLSTAHAREYDTLDSLEEKVYYATLIGDIQSLATDFRFISSGTRTVCDRDRLLGVSLVGHAVCPLIRNPGIMTHLRRLTEVVDKLFAQEFNVPRSAAITTTKPAGNSSLMFNTPAGMNAIHSVYQLRNMTVNRNSTMHKFLEEQGVPRHDYPGRDYASWFTFPVRYSENAVTLENSNAIDQLEVWRLHKLYWCHHNPSCSITYHKGEETDILEWLYENQNIINALAFFPYYHAYGIAPIMPIDKKQYNEFIETFPTIDWSTYQMYSETDERQKVMECAGGACEIQW